MPSTTITAAPVPRTARGMIWVVASMLGVVLLALGLIPVDRVVTAPGRVVSRMPTIMLQPLEASIVQAINVHEGQSVKAGDVLARLNPTFAAADVGALSAQVASLQAQVDRLQAEASGTPYTYAGIDPNKALQSAIFAQRQAEYDFKLENYQQKINGIMAGITKTKSDAAGYRNRLLVAVQVEQMRRELERAQVGSKLNTLAAMDNRAEMERNLRSSEDTVSSMERDLAAQVAERDGYVQSWHADVSEKLSDATGKLSDARESLNKAQLRKALVELRADRDATVLTVSKVSVGSVLQSGQAFITLVPADAPLEIESNIAGRDDGFVHVGDEVAIKFDTFPFIQYGMAYGAVRTISADSFTAQDDQRNPTGAVPVSGNNLEPYYRARVTIDKVELHGTPAGFHIVPGMPVTADIKVGKRTVLEYLLGRVLPVASQGMREP
jgi:HlyD family secretion protein